MSKTVTFKPGQRVRHAELGKGIVLDSDRNGYVRVFFADGEWLVAISRILV